MLYWNWYSVESDKLVCVLFSWVVNLVMAVSVQQQELDATEGHLGGFGDWGTSDVNLEGKAGACRVNAWVAEGPVVSGSWHAASARKTPSNWRQEGNKVTVIPEHPEKASQLDLVLSTAGIWLFSFFFVEYLFSPLVSEFCFWMK